MRRFSGIFSFPANTLFWVLLFCLGPDAFGQCPGLGQSPATAFPVCGTTSFDQNTVPACTGRAITTFCNDGAAYSDVNPFYYRFTCYTAGTLGFLVTPKNLNDDYDWVLYDITNRNENNIYTNSSWIVAYNFSENPGATGASNPGNLFFSCAGNTSKFSSRPTLVVGNEYLLMVSHYTSTNQSGYLLSFGGGTAGITDPVLPSLSRVTNQCASTTLGVKLNKSILCSSISANGSDFSISPANATVTAATGFGCTTGFTTDSITLTLSNTVAGGNYNLVAKNGADGNTILDNCGNALAVGAQIPFTIANIPTPVAGNNGPLCSGQSLQLTATTLAGATYSWTGPNGFTSATQNPVINPATIAAAGQYQVTATTGGCTSTAATTTVVVNNTETPTIQINANTTPDACAGTPVTFTATITNGGTTPVYQWKLNGTNVGANSNQYINNNLAPTDVVTCVLTSNATCLTTNTATSNSLTIALNPILIPAVTISASATTICAGQAITFTATPTNGGSSPVYQWKINGANAGTNNPVFTSNSLSNGDVVTCELTSNAPCRGNANGLSNAITIQVGTVVVPTISITASVLRFCTGTPVNFTAVATNGGASPVYQWRVNGVNSGVNSPTFTSNNLRNGDIITCNFTSSSSCANPTSANSNAVTVEVGDPVTPTISISTASPSVCAGSTVVFSSTTTGGGSSPQYQWLVNGVAAGTNSASFSTSTLANGDQVSCVLTSNAPCLNAATGQSNIITVTVNPIQQSSIIITADTNGLCRGNTINFTATLTNGGANPVYQWRLNGSNTGSNSPSYSNSNLANGDRVECVVTLSGILCPATPTITSNPIIASIFPIPQITMPRDTLIFQGDAFTVLPTITGSGLSYTWTPPIGLSNPNSPNPIASPLETTTYQLRVESANGCSATNRFTVTVWRRIVIPNAFSPNGDGINDTWRMDALMDYTGATVEVFDRYGRKVFESFGYPRPWDGNFQGRPLPIGTYYYIIHPKNGFNPVNGPLTIIR